MLFARWSVLLINYNAYDGRKDGRFVPTAACTSPEQAVAVSAAGQGALSPDHAAVGHSVVSSRMAGLW